MPRLANAEVRFVAIEPGRLLRRGRTPTRTRHATFPKSGFYLRIEATVSQRLALIDCPANLIGGIGMQFGAEHGPICREALRIA